jgi:HEAT repeat protein
MMMWNRLRLRSGDVQVRLNALEKLGNVSSNGVLKDLAVCLGDPDPNVRSAAALALGTGKNEQALQFLLAALTDERSEVRHAAAQGVGHFGDGQAIESLVGLLTDPFPAVRLAAEKSLERLGWKRTAGRRSAADGSDRGIKFTAALPKAGASSTKQHNPPQANGLKRNSVADALELLRDDRKVQPFLRALNGVDPIARVAAIHALGKEVARPEIAMLLHRSVTDRDGRVRLAAAQALSLQSEPSFIPTFLSLLKDKNFEVRLAAVQFLRRVRDPRHVSVFVAMLSDPDHDVRLAAAEALSELGCPSAIEALVLALSDEERAVRNAAEFALEKTDRDWVHSEAARRAGKELETLLHSRPAWVRGAVGHVLAKLQSAEKAVGAAA